MYTEELTGVRRAAVLFMAIGTDAAAGVMRHLPGEQAEAIAAEIMRISDIDAGVRDEVLHEAASGLGTSVGMLEGGEGIAFQVLAKVYGEARAKELIERIHRTQRPTPFANLRKLDPAQLKDLLVNEHPQIIALVLAHLDARAAARVLQEFDPEVQVEVALRIAKTEQTTPEAIAAIEEGLTNRVVNLVTETRPVGGIRPLADIMNKVDRKAERGIIEGLNALDEAVGKQVRDLMFTFEDIRFLDDRSMRRVMRDLTDKQVIARALRRANTEVTEKFFGNMSERQGNDIREIMESQGQLRRRDVEEAQQAIVELVRRLADAEEIVVSRGGDSEDALV